MNISCLLGQKITRCCGGLDRLTQLTLSIDSRPRSHCATTGSVLVRITDFKFSNRIISKQKLMNVLFGSGQVFPPIRCTTGRL